MTKARDLASSTPVPSAVSTTELGYVDGVTSAIQTQVDSKLATATASSTYQTKAATGLVLLNTQTFTSAGTVSFPANTFTSTYNSYFFTFNCTGSTALDLTARVTANGTPNSSNNYAYTLWAGAFTSSTTDNASSWLVGAFYDSDSKRTIHNFYIQDVQVSGRYTSGKSEGVVDLQSGATVYPYVRYHGLDVTTSYDSIAFSTSTGTITGSISCYGYNK